MVDLGEPEVPAGAAIPTNLHMFAPMVLANTNDAIMLLEYPPDATFGRIVYVNRAFTAQMGYVLEDIVGTSPRDMVSPNADPAAIAAIQSAARAGRPIRAEITNLTKDGREIWLDLNLVPLRDPDGAVRHFISFRRDITQSKQSQQETAEAEAWLRDAIESIDQGLVLYDADDCLITCNQRFKDLHRANAAALAPGASYDTIIRAAIDRGYWNIGEGDVEAWIKARLHERRSIDRRSYTQSRPDGRVLRIDELRTQNGGLVAVHADVTRAQQRERLLREAKEQAEAANLSKSQFLATMSHELRTPLNAIIGFSEILSQGVFGALTGKNLEYVADIHAAGRHLLALINDVLDMAKIEAGKYVLADESMDIADLIDECVRQVGPQVELGALRIECEADPRLCSVMADRRAMKQILLNLLSNAVKFTPEGGQIKILAEHGETGLAISVRDTGIGIPTEQLQRVLRPFEQVESTNNRTHEGTGLGLTITRRLIELHGGTLLLKSAAGAGTCATVILPAFRLEHQAFATGTA